MQASPIKVDPYDRTSSLGPRARIVYMDLYEFEFRNPNIRIWGSIDQKSEAAFYTQWQQVYTNVNATGVPFSDACLPGGPFSGATSITAAIRAMTGADTASSEVWETAPTTSPRLSFTSSEHSASESRSVSVARSRASSAWSQDYDLKTDSTAPSATAAQVHEPTSSAQKRTSFFESIKRRWRRKRGLAENGGQKQD